MPQTVQNTTPVVTIKEGTNGWEIVTLKSDKSGKSDTNTHSTKQLAEVAAKQFAERNHIIYIPSNGAFISIFHHEKYYVPVIVPFIGSVVGQGDGVSNFDTAVVYARSIAAEKNLPFNPYFYEQPCTSV